MRLARQQQGLGTRLQCYSVPYLDRRHRRVGGGCVEGGGDCGRGRRGIGGGRRGRMDMGLVFPTPLFLLLQRGPN